MTSSTVKVGNFSVRLWKASDGRWKWHGHVAGKRTLFAAVDLDKARKKAKQQLAALKSAKTELHDITPELLSEFIAWRSARVDSPTVKDAVEKYLAHLKARKVRDLRMLSADLGKFAEAHACRMSDVTGDQVQEYLEGLGVGPRRFNNVRTSLVSLYRWARKTNLVPDALTAPERTHALPIPNKAVEVYTPEQFHELLAKAPKEWRLGLAIGGLAGLRTEEIHGLYWEDIKPARKLIEVRAEICKTGRRRFVPMCPALLSWFKNSEPCDAKMVWPRDRPDNLAKWLKRRKVTWVKNGLRHSFGSYRTAQLKSAGQVALEMGNSEAMVRKHYLEVQDEDAAKRWFQSGYFEP